MAAPSKPLSATDVWRWVRPKYGSGRKRGGKGHVTRVNQPCGVNDEAPSGSARVAVAIRNVLVRWSAWLGTTCVAIPYVRCTT